MVEHRLNMVTSRVRCRYQDDFDYRFSYRFEMRLDCHVYQELLESWPMLLFQKWYLEL